MDRFHGLREYREGDDPRRIHWRTTARRGVRTYLEWRAEAGREVVVVLGRGETASPDADRRFERAVSVAATVMRLCARERLPARLVLGRETVGSRAARGPDESAGGILVTGAAGLHAALDALAVVRPQAGRRPRAALEAVGSLGRTRAQPARTVVWVGAGGDADVPERLARAAGRRGSWLHLRAQDPGLSRYVVDLP
jgi:uncharacterized protein (DUF58 family)